MNISIRQLRAALAVADEGSFTRAADALHVTQSACSGLVRELEATLGLRLFDRTTRRVAVTDAGHEFLAAARHSLADLDHAAEDARALAERRRGRVTVAAPPLLAVAVMPQVIAAFRAENPSVQVALQDVSTEEIVIRVRGGGADLGVGTFDPAEDGVDLHDLATDRLHLFCPPDHPLATRAAVPWRSLENEPIVGLTRASDVRRLTDSALGQAGLTTRPDFEVAQMATAIALVDAGVGLAILPAYAQRYTDLFAVTSRPLTEPSVTRTISLLTARDRSLPPAAQRFSDLLRDIVAAGRA
jgi:DNA-binding transcriptional LysR family regulator